MPNGVIHISAAIYTACYAAMQKGLQAVLFAALLQFLLWCIGCIGYDFSFLHVFGIWCLQCLYIKFVFGGRGEHWIIEKLSPAWLHGYIEVNQKPSLKIAGPKHPSLPSEGAQSLPQLQVQPVTGTIRIIPFLVGNPYKPLFVTEIIWNKTSWICKFDVRCPPMYRSKDAGIEASDQEPLLVAGSVEELVHRKWNNRVSSEELGEVCFCSHFFLSR